MRLRRREHPPVRRGGAWPPVVVLVLLLVASACNPPAPVIQGKVVGLSAGQVQLEDERAPGASPVVLDISRAEIGSQPEVGDELRIVYKADGQVNRALRVMNITKQNAIEKGKH